MDKKLKDIAKADTLIVQIRNLVSNALLRLEQTDR